jgi:hypothetical protein
LARRESCSDAEVLLVNISETVIIAETPVYSPVIADISIPPFTTILLIVGALLIVLALSGQITIQKATVGIPQRSLRLLAGIIGAALVSAALWLVLAPASVPLLSHSPTQSPAASPPGPVPSASIPVSRYGELKGKWVVTEKVGIDYGGYEIIWAYDATVFGNQLTMTGKKVVVNEPHEPQEKKLSPDEKATVSIFTLVLTGQESEGTFEEKDSHGLITRGDLKINFSQNLMSFTGTAANVSTLIGSKQ